MDDQKIRVELIKNPELKGLTKLDIEKWRNEYALYKEKVEAQGNGAKPVTKYHCIPIHIRKSIALQIGVKSNAITREQVFLKLNELDTKEPGRRDAVEANQVFKNLRMDPPRRQTEIASKVQDFFFKIQKRVELHGVEDILYDHEKLEFRKQSFPAIINGVWPENLSISIKQEWLNASRKWTMHELLAVIERKVHEVGAYELDRVKQQRTTGIAEGLANKKSAQMYVKKTREAKGATGGVETDSKNKRCYNCGKLLP
ncbi:MAG: hypothetical protein RLZZ262_1550 [Bacteroidota bacterium]